jgi:arylsulfatase A-like enzyme
MGILALRLSQGLRRAAICGVPVALLACHGDESSPVTRQAKVRPEIDTVVLISIDSLRADRLGAYGYKAPTSPTLDRLASQGLLFTRAYSTSSWTLPAHAAMLSGLDDYAHGAYQDRSPISDGVTTLPVRLGRAGIESTGFFAGPFLHPSYGFARGFDQYIDATSYGWKPGGEIGKDIPHAASHRDITNPIVLERLAAWLGGDAPTAEDGRRRHFVFIHLWDVHYDYIAPPEYVEIFDSDYEGGLDGRDFLRNPRIRPDMAARDLQHLLALYDAEIRYTDETIARALELFDSHGMLENSAIIVTSDHGDEFFDHGGVGHGLTLHEEVIRVPMILWLRGLHSTRSTSDRIVSHIDVVPTICDLFEVDCGYDGLGESFFSDYVGHAPAARRQDALAELTSSHFGLDLTARIDSTGAILRDNRSGRLLYEPLRGTSDPSRFFRVHANTIDRNPEVVGTAASLMRKRSVDAKRLGKTIQGDGKRVERAIDANTIKQLEALGYLQGEATEEVR